MLANKYLKLFEGDLVGSAGSLESLLKLAKEKLYQKNLTFKETGKGTWSLHNDDGELEAWIVKQKGKRFRIELTGKENKKPAKKALPRGTGKVTGKNDDGYSIDGDKYFAGSNQVDKKVKVGSKVEFEYNPHGFAFNVKVIK